jgi:hypothetical protein
MTVERVAWHGIVVTLLHYVPRSKGARVTVTKHGRHIVSSPSYEGMTVDDPNIQSFLAWALDYYHGAEFREVKEESTP